ncbi:TPA: restriction endonuclease subunit S, partial [Streptococcus suis]|nr:restriction endonuclease subunit S [Streptococcus suis]
VYKVEWKTLGEILIKGRGTKVTAGQMKELHKDGAPIRIFAGGKTFADVDYGDIPEKDVHHEEAIIVKSRGIIDFEYYTKPFSFKNEFWSYSSDSDDVNLRYIYHYLNHNKSHFQHIAGNMQMPQISSNDTEKYKIPLPTKTVQSRIVQVLDNFDAVCNDLNIGLPKEIELRQKQYEYFREKLLTFTAEGVYTDSTVQYSTDKT